MKQYASARLQASYGLAIEKPHALVLLKLPPMTLAKAEFWRDYIMEAMGKTLLVVNLQAE